VQKPQEYTLRHLVDWEELNSHIDKADYYEEDHLEVFADQPPTYVDYAKKDILQRYLEHASSP
jgi:hypothetical protein